MVSDPGQSRVPRGVPSGGEFAASAKGEAGVSLGARPTRQTPGPIVPLSLAVEARRAKGLVEELDDGLVDLAPPYQRGSVWTEDQQVELVRSLLARTPIPAIIVNNRATPAWLQANGTSPREAGGPPYAVVDGRQRMEALRAWFRGDLAVPASWFADDEVAETVDTDDGPYTTYDRLTLERRRNFNQEAKIPYAAASLATEREEAELYLRVNGGGTAQTAADMANAAQVAAR